MPFSSRERVLGESPVCKISIQRPDYDSRVVSVFAASAICPQKLEPIWSSVDRKKFREVIEQAIVADLQAGEHRLIWKFDESSQCRLLRLIVEPDNVRIELHAADRWVQVPEERSLEALAGMYVHLTEFHRENRLYLEALEQARSKPGWEDSASYQGWLHCGGCGIPPTIGKVVIQ